MPKPSDVEQGQFYMQRYISNLPNAGEIVFFDRSWYNRAVVEPVFNFCTKDQYDKFMDETPYLEKSLIRDDIVLIKLWFSIEKEVQAERFEKRKKDPLRQWKLSEIDAQAQGKWDEITWYKDEMFKKTHTEESPWVIVNGNNKKSARIESIKYVLSKFDYENKDLNIPPINDKILSLYKPTKE